MKFPYAGLPAHQIWKRAVSSVAPATIDPQAGARFTFDRTARIASAGSCFAQRIAEALQLAGYTYFVTEPGPVERNFGRYSARYGDIYTTVHLQQLAERAIGRFVPDEAPWAVSSGYVDPLRPRVEPGGFATVAELEADRDRHLTAFRRLLRESEVFIFTLGLTEGWFTASDGSALPLCPGTGGIGTFDEQRYVFRNLSVDENVAALEAFLAIAWELNPGLRVILTVSPVPLAATMEPQHVIASTVYSKSVLRVAAETIRSRHPAVDYFASYEMVGTAFDGTDHYEADRREVSASGVERVMQSFFRHFTADGARPVAPYAPAGHGTTIELSLDAVARVAALPRSPNDPCDEGYLANVIAQS